MAKRGRPKLYDISDHEVCKECKYYYSYSKMCGYCLSTGKCRTIKDGKHKLAKGKCDKFTPGSSRNRREAFNYGVF